MRKTSLSPRSLVFFGRRPRGRLSGCTKSCSESRFGSAAVSKILPNLANLVTPSGGWTASGGQHTTSTPACWASTSSSKEQARDMSALKSSSSSSHDKVTHRLLPFSSATCFCSIQHRNATARENAARTASLGGCSATAKSSAVAPPPRERSIATLPSPRRTSVGGPPSSDWTISPSSDANSDASGETARPRESSLESSGASASSTAIARASAPLSTTALCPASVIEST